MVAGAMEYTSPYEAADVTEEMLRLADFIYDQWFAEGNGNPIDWRDFLYRMDGQTLEDGSTLDLGALTDSPAIEKIRRHVRGRADAS